MPLVSSFHFLLGPLVALVAMGLLALLCRWVFSTDHRAARRTGPVVRDLGLLVPVTRVRSRADAEMLRDVLAAAGIRAGISEEHEVLVFAGDEARARSLVAAS